MLTNKKAHPERADQIQLKVNTKSKEKQEYILAANEKRRDMIMFKLKGRKMTARELAYEMGFYERNATAPRLTELEQRGQVIVVGKRIDPITKVSVRIYQRVDEFQEEKNVLQ